MARLAARAALRGAQGVQQLRAVKVERHTREAATDGFRRRRRAGRYHEDGWVLLPKERASRQHGERRSQLVSRLRSLEISQTKRRKL